MNSCPPVHQTMTFFSGDPINGSQDQEWYDGDIGTNAAPSSHTQPINTGHLGAAKRSFWSIWETSGKGSLPNRGQQAKGTPIRRPSIMSCL